jgi:GT2 family glycosyltransferase
LKPSADAGLVDVWVVDNGSTDGSREAVREEFGWVTLERPGRNLGFGAAVNLVAARTRGDWIAPANADVALTPGAVQSLLEAGVRHPEAGILAPRLLLPDGSTQHSVFPFPSVRVSLLLGSQVWRLSPALADRLCLVGAWNPDTDRAVPWAVGAFLLVRRPLFDEVGGFDERQWMYAEDLDLAWRVRRAGSSTRYIPGARVRHDESAATTQAFGSQIRARHMAASYAWLRRRRGAATATAYGIANLASSLVWAAWLGPLALVRPGRRRQLIDALDWARVHLRAVAGRDPAA